LEFDHISGVATAGIAHGALLADHLQLPFSYVRSSAKKHGRQNKIEGHIAEGSKILVIEDLISTGGSSILAVEDLREAGYDVAGVMAIFTYEFEKAQANFDKANCKFDTLSRYSVMIDQAATDEYITQDQARILGEWSKSPNEWFDNNF